jgi:hypothetical protein
LKLKMQGIKVEKEMRYGMKWECLWRI